MSTLLLEATGLRKTYRLGDTCVAALRGVDVRVARGEFLVVAGPSGSGKSALLWRSARNCDWAARKARILRLTDGDVPELVRWVEERIAARDRARKSKDFKEADRIRQELLTRGVELDDTAAGTQWRMV